MTILKRCRVCKNVNHMSGDIDICFYCGVRGHLIPVTHKPYITEEVLTIVKKYNKDYGDERVCECGHRYYRHFDTYDDMEAIGCKYCECDYFIEEYNGN